MIREKAMTKTTLSDDTKNTPKITGFLAEPRKTASKKPYGGKFTCDQVQWTGQEADMLATFTITAEELADAAEALLLWTDQDVQRGIQPGLTVSPPRELSLSEGYPKKEFYIFDENKADDIAEKLLRGDRLFLSPLVWNLRPGTFEAYWDEETREIYLYSGKAYLPDSHHRQQAILKAVKIWREDKDAYRKFTGAKQFKVELYFLSKEDEGNYFFDKNQLPKPTAKSKAYDLTTQDDLSLLAKMVISKSKALQDNVNRVTDRLSPKNPQVITLSTMREMMKAFSYSDALDAAEIEGLATIAATFYDLLATIRPELSKLTPPDRRKVREKLIVDSAVMMHGYAALMKEYNDAIGKDGNKKATAVWQNRLKRFSATQIYEFQNWSGDLFDKKNPLWQRVGVVKPGKDGRRLTVVNTGGARSGCISVLKQLSTMETPPKSLLFLAQH